MTKSQVGWPVKQSSIQAQRCDEQIIMDAPMYHALGWTPSPCPILLLWSKRCANQCGIKAQWNMYLSVFCLFCSPINFMDSEEYLALIRHSISICLETKSQRIYLELRGKNMSKCCSSCVSSWRIKWLLLCYCQVYSTRSRIKSPCETLFLWKEISIWIY